MHWKQIYCAPENPQSSAGTREIRKLMYNRLYSHRIRRSFHQGRRLTVSSLSTCLQLPPALRPRHGPVRKPVPAPYTEIRGAFYQIQHNFMCCEVLYKLSKEYLNSLTCKIYSIFF